MNTSKAIEILINYMLSLVISMKRKFDQRNKKTVKLQRKKEKNGFRILEKVSVTCYQRLFNRLVTFKISAHSRIIVHMSRRCSFCSLSMVS